MVQGKGGSIPKKANGLERTARISDRFESYPLSLSKHALVVEW